MKRQKKYLSVVFVIAIISTFIDFYTEFYLKWDPLFVGGGVSIGLLIAFLIVDRFGLQLIKKEMGESRNPFSKDAKYIIIYMPLIFFLCAMFWIFLPLL